MKTLFQTIILSAVTAGLAGCTPNDTFLRADASLIEISAEDTSEHSVAVEASSSWMVNTTGGADWLSVRYDAADGNLLWVKALEKNESLEDRVTEITIVSGDGRLVTIPLVHLAMVVNFDVTPRTIEPFGPRDNSKRTVAVETNITWEAFVLNSADWINTVRGPEDNNTLTISVKPTRSLDERRDTIILQPVNEVFRGYSDTLAVVQQGIDLVVDSESMNETTYDIEIPAGGGEVNMWVYSRNTWRVSTGASADRVTLNIDGGEGDIEYGIPVVMTVVENTDEAEYEFTLTFESAGETYDYICRQQSGNR